MKEEVEMPGFLITVVVALLVVGILLWALSALPWIDGDIKQAIRVIVIVIVALWLLGVLLGYAPMVPAYPYRR
jgi:hypothetical protein